LRCILVDYYIFMNAQDPVRRSTAYSIANVGFLHEAGALAVCTH